MSAEQVLYRTVTADPLWQYRNMRTGGNLKSGSGQKYGTLSVNQIRAIPVGDVVHPDSCLFLWTTMPFLREGLLVMESWGFRYVTSLVWEKVGRLGMGFWFRCQTEMCLVGARGKMKPLRCQSRNIIHAPPTSHSTKPEEFFKLVTPCTPGPRLEMFGRVRHEGWDVWGAEAQGGSDIDLEVPILAGNQ